MRLDSLVIHADDMGAVVGKFYESDIREVNLLSVEVREEIESQSNARFSLGTKSAEIVLLHDEVIQEGLIRRFTTSEVVGETFYDKEIPEGRQIPLHTGLVQTQKAGSLITWRPNNMDIAIYHEESAE